MARKPCSFSAQEDFLLRIDKRAAQLGMKRSEFIVHALRKELLNSGAMTVIAEQSGSNNQQNVFSNARSVPAVEPRKKSGAVPKFSRKNQK